MKPNFHLGVFCLFERGNRKCEKKTQRVTTGYDWGRGEKKQRGVFVNSEARRDASCKLAGDWLVGLTLQL